MINLGRTAGYYDLHMGHSVVDQRREVEQYGRKADVRFVQLDHIVSNGFQSWAWEDGGQHGGWGGSTLIVQIRSVYVEEPLNIWRALHDQEQLDAQYEHRNIVADRRGRRSSTPSCPRSPLRPSRGWRWAASSAERSAPTRPTARPTRR